MKIQLLKIPVLILLLLFSLSNKAQEVKIKAVLDSTVILIGDQVTLNLQIEYPKQLEVQFPMPGDSLGSSVEIVERLQLEIGRASCRERV